MRRDGKCGCTGKREGERKERGGEDEDSGLTDQRALLGGSRSGG